MNATKYRGSWGTWEDMRRNFSDNADGSPDGFATDEEVVIALYGGGCYDGTALVVFERDGKLYEVNGSHCSCFGLEGQWGPEETTWAALAKRKLASYDYDDDVIAAWKNCVAAHT